MKFTISQKAREYLNKKSVSEIIVDLVGIKHC